MPLDALPGIGESYIGVCRSQWSPASIVTVGQLFSDGIALTFADLCEQTGLNSGQFLTHAALIALVQKHWGHSASEPIADLTQNTILTWSSKHHRTTNLYRAITKPPQPTLPILKTI